MNKSLIPALAALWSLSSMTALADFSGTIHVDSTKVGGLGNGLSWDDAFLTLQQGLDAAQLTVDAGFEDVEVWVAEGVYYPDEGGLASDNDRSSTFQLLNGVAIYGGFPDDGTATSLGDRDPGANPTILSGDLSQDDSLGANPSGTNAYHVVTASGTDDSASLSGFTITSGLADSGADLIDRRGAGILCVTGAASFSECLIDNNVSESYGAGSFLNTSSDCRFTECVFSDNETTGNSQRGAGMFIEASHAVFLNCSIVGNRSNFHAGAIFLDQAATVEMTNCLVSGNYANGNGGAIYLGFESGMTMTNCTVAGNSSIAAGAGINSNSSELLTATNCIFWDNYSISNDSTDGGGDSLNHSNRVMTNCLVEGIDLTGEGSGNFDGANPFNDPLFVDPLDTLSNPAIGGDYRVGSTSITIDAGDNSANSEPFDLNGATRIQDGTIDLGPFEGGVDTAYASPLFDHLTYPASQADSIPAAYDLGTVFVDPSGASSLAYVLKSNSDPAFATSVTVAPTGVVDLTLSGNGITVLVFTATNLLGSADFTLYVSRRLGTIFVDASAGLGADGTSWGSAFKNLQDALALAVEGDEIWVADGVYYPDEGGFEAEDNDPFASFLVVDGVALYGGFAGGEGDLSLRQPSVNRTILSGDIEQNDTTTGNEVLDPDDLVGTNSYHVLTLSDGSIDPTVSQPTLDGLIITGGWASPEDQNGEGGGMITQFINGETEFLIRDCEFRGNRARFEGGAIQGGQALRLEHCLFEHNRAEFRAGAVAIGSSGTFTDCTFRENLVGEPGTVIGPEASDQIYFRGGAAINTGGGISAVRCLFEGNESAFSGGAVISNRVSSFEGCVFSGNRAAALGGAIQYIGDSLTLVNTTVSGNKAGLQGGGLGFFGTGTSIQMKNSVVWGNLAEQALIPTDHALTSRFDTVQTTPSTSLVQFFDFTVSESSNIDGTDGGNFPRFVDPFDPNTAPGTGGDLALASFSPLLDAGNNADSSVTTDLAGNARIQGGTIDIGAYEGIAGTYDHYEEWIDQYYPGITDPAIVGLNADPNGDGVKNISAYLTATDPSMTDSAAIGIIDPEKVTFRSLQRGFPFFTEFEASTDVQTWMDPVTLDPSIEVTVTPGFYGIDFAGFAIDKVEVTRGSLPKVFFRQDHDAL
ncbi:right-handed parallel beta-helix repeat-containing protein [Haloferula sp.]|uniref:right-handed parallel beta-helix repeat-containing protein n=1 Tax=Haloferula sp. TaxID=2497595 RepID=UPI00329DBB1F